MALLKKMNKGIRTTFAISVGYVALKWTLILLVGGALYESGYWNNWYLLVIPVIGLTTLLIRRRIKSKKNNKAYVDH